MRRFRWCTRRLKILEWFDWNAKSKKIAVLVSKVPGTLMKSDHKWSDAVLLVKENKMKARSGVGGRFTFNVNRKVALEAEINFFPRDFEKFTTNFTGGRLIEGLFGVKSGIRRKKLGFFGKCRPGFESSGHANISNFPNGNGPDPNNRFGIEFIRATQFAVDVGGVVELYPSRRTIVRFDLGDTMVRYPGVQFVHFPDGALIVKTVWSHKPQFGVGFGFRF